MRGSSQTAVLSIALLLLGCSAEQSDLVFIRYEDARLAYADTSGGVAATPAIPASVGGDDLNLPELSASAEQRQIETEGVERALDEVRQNQERAFLQLLATFRARNNAELRALESSERERLRGLFQDLEDAAIADLRSAFEAYADEAGPHIHELAWLVGVPPESSSRFRLSQLDAPNRSERITSLRAALRALDANYEQAVSTRLDQMRQEYISALEAGQIRLLQAEQELEGDALRSAEQIANTTFRGIEIPELTVSELREIPGVSAKVAEAAGLPAVMVETRSNDAFQMTLEREAQVFAELHGYALSKNPGRGRDATEEFVEWRRKFRPDPLER